MSCGVQNLMWLFLKFLSLDNCQLYDDIKSHTHICMHLLHKCNYVCICVVSSAGKSVIDSFSPPLVGE